MGNGAAAAQHSAHPSTLSVNVAASKGAGEQTQQRQSEPEPSSGLANRRKFRGRLQKSWSINTSTKGETLMSRLIVVMSGHGTNQDVHTKGKLRRVENFAELYTLSIQVMPSGHPAMEVRHAFRMKDGKRVVVKTRCKKGSFASAEEERDWRINTEFMLSIPKNKHVCEFIDFLEDDEKYYVVMEEVAGEDLFEFLDHHGRLPLTECRSIIRELLVAVQCLHDRHVIHKDLKLENVMISPSRTPSVSPAKRDSVRSWASASTASGHSDNDSNGGGPTVKLIDFDTVEEWTPGGSQARSVVGTDQYIAPEAYGGKYTPAADIFAVGVIAYKVLTGRFPFDPKMFDDEAGENWIGSPKMKQIQNRLRHCTIDFSLEPFASDKSLCEFCKSMLAIDENDRPPANKLLEHRWLVNAETVPSTEAGNSRASSRSSIGSGDPVLLPSHSKPLARPHSS